MARLSLLVLAVLHGEVFQDTEKDTLRSYGEMRDVFPS